MKNKKHKFKIVILILTLIILSVGIYIAGKPQNNDFIMGNDMDSTGNLYTLSYDENNVYLKKIDSNKKIIWTSKFPKVEGNYMNSMNSLVVTPEGQVIMYLYKYDVTTYKKVSEQIYLYSKDGKNKTLILDDRMDLGGEQTVFSMYYYNNNVYFFQDSPDKSNNYQLVDLKKIDLNTLINGVLPEEQKIKTVKYDADVRINNLIYTKDNSIIFSTYDSKIYKVNENDENDQIYPIDNKESKGISGLSYDSNNNIYFQNVGTNKIMTISVKDSEVSELYDNDNLKKLGIDFSKLKKVRFVSSSKFFGMQAVENEKTNKISVFDNNNVEYYKDLKYSKLVLFERCGVASLCILGILGLALGIISLIRRYNNNKLTISIKIIFIFIPIITISIVVMLLVSKDKLTNVVNQQLIEQIFAISKNKLDVINGDVLKKIDWTLPYEDENYKDLNNKLQLGRKDDKIFNNVKQSDIEDPHNSIYSLLYTVQENKIYTGICDLNYVNIPIDYIYSKDDMSAYEKAVKERKFVYTELKDSAGDWLAVISPIMDSNQNVVGLIEVGITKQGFVNSNIVSNVKYIVIINSIIGIIMIITLVICLFYLLSPLKRLKIGVTALMEGELGVQVMVKSNDEVAEISEVFNKMSENLKINMDKLTKLNDAYHRFVPLKMFEILNKNNILDVRIGDQVKTNIALLSLITNNFRELSYRMNTSEIFLFINKIFNLIVPIIDDQGGVVERYNNSGLISLFSKGSSDSIKSAIKIRELIRNCEDEKLNKVDLGFVINKEDIMVGIIGCKERFDASVVSDYLTIVEGLNEVGQKYGTSILVTESSMEEIIKNGVHFNYRKLGYIRYKNRDQVVALYDFFDGDNYNTLVRKKQTKDIFEDGVNAYYNKDFYNARRMFIEILKQFQEDKASKEYLRLCDKYYKMKETENVDICIELF